jgi:hypothetical protein
MSITLNSPLVRNTVPTTGASPSSSNPQPRFHQPCVLVREGTDPHSVTAAQTAASIASMSSMATIVFRNMEAILLRGRRFFSYFMPLEHGGCSGRGGEPERSRKASLVTLFVGGKDDAQPRENEVLGSYAEQDSAKAAEIACVRSYRYLRVSRYPAAIA